INVTLDGGTSAVNKQRNMQTTEHRLLAYDIFSDSSYTQNWSPDSSHKYGGGTGEPLIIPLYARLDTHGAIPVAGKYQDIINVTVNY
ncbi:spore coat protein U domain-containing protein, partial [Yokenella regensburgei]